MGEKENEEERGGQCQTFGQFKLVPKNCSKSSNLRITVIQLVSSWVRESINCKFLVWLVLQRCLIYAAGLIVSIRRGINNPFAAFCLIVCVGLAVGFLPLEIIKERLFLSLYITCITGLSCHLFSL